MVTATKALFNNLAHEADIMHIFRQTSRALKRMNLRSLYMAMVMVKVKGSELRVSAAGMPPLLVNRAANRGVEEWRSRACRWGVCQISLTDNRADCPRRRGATDERRVS